MAASAEEPFAKNSDEKSAAANTTAAVNASMELIFPLVLIAFLLFKRPFIHLSMRAPTFKCSIKSAACQPWRQTPHNKNAPKVRLALAGRKPPNFLLSVLAVPSASVTHTLVSDDESAFNYSGVMVFIFLSLFEYPRRCSERYSRPRRYPIIYSPVQTLARF